MKLMASAIVHEEQLSPHTEDDSLAWLLVRLPDGQPSGLDYVSIEFPLESVMISHEEDTTCGVCDGPLNASGVSVLDRDSGNKQTIHDSCFRTNQHKRI